MAMPLAPRARTVRTRATHTTGSNTPERVISPQSAPRWHAAAAVVAIVFNIAAVARLRFFPYGDMANHLARYSLISRSWQHTAPAWVQFRWIPTSYIAVDVLGAALVWLLGPFGASLALTIAYLVVLPMGMFALLRAVNPRTIAWSLVGSLLAFNWCFLTGFYSYSVGVGLAMLWLAWWWPRRAGTTLRTRIIGAAGIAALYLVHMSAAATALTAVGVACIEPLLVPRPTTGHRRWREVAARCITTMVYAVGPLLINVVMRLQGGRLGHPPDTMVFRDPADKLRHILTPFASFSRGQTAFLVAAYVVAVWLRFRGDWPAITRVKWMLTTVALLLAYAVFPVLFIGAWDVDVRFLLPAFLLIFVLPAARETRPPRPAIVAVLLALVFVQASITWWYGRRIDRTLANVVRLLPVTASNTLVLPTEEDDYFRVDPFTHAGEWATVDNPNARVSGLFAGGPGGAHLDHFLVDRWLYDPGIHWARRDFTPLDWTRVRADYQFILVTGSNATGLARASEGAIVVASDPAGRLLRVLPLPEPMSGDRRAAGAVAPAGRGRAAER